MNAAQVVEALLEGPPRNAKNFIMKHDDWEWLYHDFEKRMPPEFKRRKGKGHDQQWETRYGDSWLFVVSTYDDGKTLWSAFYRVPKLNIRGVRLNEWGGGSEIEELPPGADLNVYYQRLKHMADKHPDPWKERHIPYMPDPQGPDQWRGNY